MPTSEESYKIRPRMVIIKNAENAGANRVGLIFYDFCYGYYQWSKCN